MAGPDELLHQQPVQQQRNQFRTEDEAFQQAWDARTDNMDLLLDSQRSILGINVKDSPEMAQVKQSLRALNQSLVPGSQDLEPVVMQRYAAAIEACNHYITVKGQPRTEQGRARLHMVQQLLPKLKLEQTVFIDAVSSMNRTAWKDYQRDLGWQHMLYHAHVAQFDVKNDQLQPVDVHGMAALEVTRVGQSVDVDRLVV